MKADVILLNPSYVYPPFSKALMEAIYDDPLVMDLPSLEFMYPPMGLLSIGGALRRAGFSVKGIDSNTMPMTMEQLASYCEGAKVVGISLLVANKDQLNLVINVHLTHCINYVSSRTF